MDFPDFLIRLMKERGLTGKELAERLNVYPSWISQIRKGTSHIPPESITAWVRALKLKSDEAVQFRLAALLDQSPSEVQEHVRELEARIKRLESR